MIDFDPHVAEMDRIIDAWLPLTFAVNSINRSMGLPDLYPFVLDAGGDLEAGVHSQPDSRRRLAPSAGFRRRRAARHRRRAQAFGRLAAIAELNGHSQWMYAVRNESGRGALYLSANEAFECMTQGSCRWLQRL